MVNFLKYFQFAELHKPRLDQASTEDLLHEMNRLRAELADAHEQLQLQSAAMGTHFGSPPPKTTN